MSVYNQYSYVRHNQVVPISTKLAVFIYLFNDVSLVSMTAWPIVGAQQTFVK